MMRKKTTFGFALTCVLVAAAIAFTAGFLIAGNKVKSVTETTAAANAGSALVDEVSKIIKDNYLGTINQNDLTAGMCKGYVEGLGDGAVKYLTAEEYANYNKGTSGETIIYKNFGKGIGYMQFLEFSDSTKTSFTNALNDFSKSTLAKVNMLVLDLRNCTTGDIDTVAALLDVMLPEGETIAGIDKNGNRTVLYTSDQSEIDYDIAVLVNGKTAGVAEIFASTLSAYGKAIIVGTTTKGDCARSEVFPLSNGDYVLIPNMYYVTKGQQTYASTGVVPSNVIEMSAADQKLFDEGSLDIAVDTQFLGAVRALGVNDIVMPNSSDTDSDKKSSDTDDSAAKNGSDNDSDSDSDSDSDRTTSARTGNTSGDDSDTESQEDDDPYWDDDEYWNNQNNSGNDNEEYNGDDYYDYDED